MMGIGEGPEILGMTNDKPVRIRDEPLRGWGTNDKVLRYKVCGGDASNGWWGCLGFQRATFAYLGFVPECRWDSPVAKWLP
jgi:hypothetical protein